MRIFGKGILNFGKAHWKAVIAVIWMVFATNKLIQIESEVSSIVSSIRWEVSYNRPGRVSSIRQEVSSIRRDVSSIESDVSSIESDVSSIKREVGSISREVGSIYLEVLGIYSQVLLIQ